MFDETINRQQLLDNLSIQVEHIKTRVDEIESTARNSIIEPVTIMTVTSNLSSALGYINQAILPVLPQHSDYSEPQ